MEKHVYLEMAAVEAEHWWFAGRRRILKAIIRRLRLRPTAEILELGSGTGGNLSLLEQFGRVTAVEMNETARAISLTKTNSVDVRLGALPDALPFLETQMFDLICLFDVLEHVEDDLGALRAVRGLLAPGASAIITVPAYKRLFGPHDIQLHHKRRYEREELRNLLVDAGLEVEKLSFMNTGLLPVAWLLRVWDKAKSKDRASGAAFPPPLINIILSWIFGAEAYLLPQTDLPFGLSLIAIVRRID